MAISLQAKALVSRFRKVGQLGLMRASEALGRKSGTLPCASDVEEFAALEMKTAAADTIKLAARNSRWLAAGRAETSRLDFHEAPTRPAALFVLLHFLLSHVDQKIAVQKVSPNQ